MNKKLITGIITFVLIAYVLWRINIAQAINALLLLNPLYIIIFIAGISASFFIKAFQWEQLIKIFEKPKFYATYIFIVLSNISGKLTPGNIGEFYRGELLSKNLKIPRSKSYSTVLVDKIISFFSVFIIIAIAVIIASEFFTRDIILTIILSFILFITAFAALLLVIFNYSIKDFIIKIIPSRFKDYVSSTLNNLKSAFTMIKNNHKNIIISLFFGIIYWQFSCLLSWLLLIGFGYTINILYMTTALLITMLITMIPVTISGFGAREVSLMFFLEKVGVPAETTVTFSLVSYLLNMLALILLNQFLKKESVKL